MLVWFVDLIADQSTIRTVESSCPTMGSETSISRDSLTEDTDASRNVLEGMERMLAKVPSTGNDEDMIGEGDVIDADDIMLADRIIPGSVIGETKSTEGTTVTVYKTTGAIRIPKRNCVVTTTTTEIDWSLFPVRKIETKHVVSFASRTHSLDEITEEVLERSKKELVVIREQIKVYAKRHIHFYFLQGFKEKAGQMGNTDLVNSVKSMSDIVRYHRSHCDTAEGQQIIGYVLFGYWDSRKGWEIDLERKWMSDKRWRYKEMGSDRKKGEVSNWKKGSIAKIIMDTKESQVKRIRKAGKVKEVKILKSRKGEVSTGRRKHGEFQVKIKHDTTGEHKKEEETAEEKMRRAALRVGLSYAQFDAFLQNYKLIGGMHDMKPSDDNDGIGCDSDINKDGDDDSINETIVQL